MTDTRDLDRRVAEALGYIIMLDPREEGFEAHRDECLDVPWYQSPDSPVWHCSLCEGWPAWSTNWNHAMALRDAINAGPGWKAFAVQLWCEVRSSDTLPADWLDAIATVMADAAPAHWCRAFLAVVEESK